MQGTTPTIAQFLKDNSITVDHYASIRPGDVSMLALPAVVAVDRDGRVDVAWFGVDGREREILETLMK